MPYNPADCQSLLRYARDVHKDSGGICVYCDFGKGDVDFDRWRQLSLEHVIPQVWAKKEKLVELLHEKFPDMGEDERRIVARCADKSNSRTACHFCNSMTSRWDDAGLKKKFGALFSLEAPDVRELGAPEVRALMRDFKELVQECFTKKERLVAERLESLEEAFEGTDQWEGKYANGGVRAELRTARENGGE